MMRRSTYKAFALLVTTMLMAVACGGSDLSDTGGDSSAGQNDTNMATQSINDEATASTNSATSSSQSHHRLIVVAEGEPETFYLRDACSRLIDLNLDNVYESLTKRTRDGNVVGQLAESYERIDETTWRFHLREDVTFHNGEVFNANAVVAAIDHYMNPDITSRCSGTWSTIEWPAKKVDEHTVDIVTSTPDPILPTRILKLRIPAPEWAATVSKEEMATTAVGTGPYELAEWDRGNHVLLKAYEGYWGEDKATIPEVEIIGRQEPSVRASMVEAGEAHIAYIISPSLIDEMPDYVVDNNNETIGIRLNTQHPILQDVGVRKAIALSINTQALIESLFPESAVQLNGQMGRPNSVGYNPNLEPYPYDPERAKQLIEEAGMAGEALDLIVRAGSYPMATEVGEAVSNMISETGLDVAPVNMQADPWREQLYAVEPGQPRSDILMTGATNSLLDSSRNLEAYYGTGRFSHQDDEEIAQMINEAAQLSGEERDAAYQDIWKAVYDDYYMIPLFGLNYVHGIDPAVQWEPRDDNFVRFNEIEFAE